MRGVGQSIAVGAPVTGQSGDGRTGAVAVLPSYPERQAGAVRSDRDVQLFSPDLDRRRSAAILSPIETRSSGLPRGHNRSIGTDVPVVVFDDVSLAFDDNVV